MTIKAGVKLIKQSSGGAAGGDKTLPLPHNLYDYCSIRISSLVEKYLVVKRKISSVDKADILLTKLIILGGRNMGTTEMVQALASPAVKLIEAVSGAIGKVYEPKHIRKMADAKAYELQVISDTVRNNSDVPIVYDSTGVSIDTSDFEQILKRASSRLAYQEITKQQNIEAVVGNAYEELENVENVSSEPVSQDWMFRFFNSVENISDKDMQTIWGHILAGEIKQPDTYSFRTLEKLKNMTQKEAKNFQMVSSLALQTGGRKFILSEDSILNKHGVYFSHILELEECGLMMTQSLSLEIAASAKESYIIYNSGLLGLISGKEDQKRAARHAEQRPCKVRRVLEGVRPSDQVWCLL